jgi:hypothetical protein
LALHNARLTVAAHSLRDGYACAQNITLALSGTEDAREPQAAFIEKRQPVGQGMVEMTPARSIVERGDVRIEVLSQGQGPIVVLLSSLGHGSDDSIIWRVVWLASATARCARLPAASAEARGR